MKRHVCVSKLDESDGFHMLCIHCGDRLKLEGKDQPFWLFLALQELFAAEHEACRHGDMTAEPLFATLTYSRQSNTP